MRRPGVRHGVLLGTRPPADATPPVLTTHARASYRMPVSTVSRTRAHPATGTRTVRGVRPEPILGVGTMRAA